MFRPRRCPYAGCLAHRGPRPGDFVRKGSYWPKCRPWPVPRFRCKRCRRTFSRQTFRADYRDHKPHLNVELFWLLASGLGLRQSARRLKLSKRCTELKFRKIAAHLRRLHENLSGQFGSGVELMMDEMETFETCRSTRPLTLPVLIERESMFVIAAESAPIRPTGAMPPRRRARIRREEAKRGRRPNLSLACIRRVLEAGRACLEPDARALLITDQKSAYPTLAREVFGDRVFVQQHPGSARRDTRNPLFRINLTNALARDLNGRLRRRSWLVSKEHRFLNAQLGIFLAFRNYHRLRFNHDDRTPAQIAGFVRERLSVEQLLSWRQDWGHQSPHPTAGGSRTIEEIRARAA